VPVRRTITPQEEIRRRCGFGVVQLAQAAGYSHTYVSLVEAGQLKPSPKYRAAISSVLHVPEDVIFDRERERV
jgi:transcriptional regulator with XRE-family HTH domain